MNARLIVRQSSVNKQGLALIQVRYTHKSENFHLSTGLSIEPKHWDFKTETIRKSKRGYIKLNAILIEKKQQVLDLAQSALLQNIDPTVEYIKDEISGKNVKRDIPSLMNFIDRFIEESKAVRSKSTINSYKVSFKFLKDYQIYKGIKLDYASINLEFYYDYIRYMHLVKKNGVNGLSNKIKHVKVWMERSLDLNYHSNITFKNRKFVIPRRETTHIYLTELEIASLLSLDLSNNTRLEKVRDLFGIACLTGLRFSDINTLKQQHFKGDYIHLNTVKCNKEVVIPVHPELKIIVARYQDERGNFFLPQMSNQKLNTYLKELGKKAGIDEEIVLKIDVAGVMVEEISRKYDLITSHTGRRSMISNLILRGIDSNIIKKISGHDSLAFMTYVKISPIEAATTVKNLWDVAYGMKVA